MPTDTCAPLPQEYTLVALHVDASNQPWHFVFMQAAVHLLLPILVPITLIISRLLGRPVRLGVVKCKTEMPESN